jgi:hypothetical protein
LSHTWGFPILAHVVMLGRRCAMASAWCAWPPKKNPN